MEREVYYQMKNDALKFIRSYPRRSSNRTELKAKLENLQKAVAYVPVTGQEIYILMSTFFKNIDNLEAPNFQRFLLCCLPESELEKKTSCALVEWLLSKFSSFECQEKCLILIKWINSMVNNNLINVSHLDVHYACLFKIVEHDLVYLNAMCALLFVLSDYGNTITWMLNLLQNLKRKDPNNKCLSMLLKKLELNEMKSKVSGNHLTWPYASGLSAMNKMLKLKRINSKDGSVMILNNIIKNDDATSASEETAIIPLAQIKTPSLFAELFHMISLPDDIQTLLNCNLGVLKTILDADMEFEFITKLNFKLSDMFMNERSFSKYKECERKSMLQIIYKFQRLIQQGIDCVSKFLIKYLKTWNGLDFKEEILQLCEWFVFENLEGLIDDFLKPLHAFLMTSEAKDKKLYIQMYSNLYSNLIMESDLFISTDQHRLFVGFEDKNCHWMRDEEESNSIFSKLSNFILSECSMTILYNEEDQVQLLSDTLDLCVNVLIAEEKANKQLLSMIPKRVVYLPLFSYSLRNISSVCCILDKYKQYQRSERLCGLYEDEFNLIDGYIEDFINFLWRGTGWNDRSKGEVFSFITEDIALKDKYSAKQLNRSLYFRNHIAIEILVHGTLKALNLKGKDLTNEIYLNTILQSLCPTLVAFITTYRDD